MTVKMIKAVVVELLEAAPGRGRYERPRAVGDECPKGTGGSRHGHRERRLLGKFGATTIRAPCARLTTAEGKTSEGRNASIPAYQQQAKRADAMIAWACFPRPTGAG